MFDQRPLSNELMHTLIGAWRLITWQEILPDGRVQYPLGETARGQLLYSEDGHVAAQLVSADRARLKESDWRQASTEEAARTWKEYFGYFGTFSIDEKEKAVIHHVDGAWFPNIEHTQQVRHFRLEGRRLILDADTEWGKVRIIWERERQVATRGRSALG